MASNINYTSIDETYPIAGKDNDSQGFRDNFGYIKNSLSAAKSEIETLQLNTAKLNASNEFNENTISGAQFINCGETFYDGQIVNVNTLVEYTNGSLQIFQVTNDIIMSLSAFPSPGIAARMRLHLTGNDNTHTITFSISGGGSIKKSTRVPGTITVNSSTEPVVIDFWTYNGGSTVFMDYWGAFA